MSIWNLLQGNESLKCVSQMLLASLYQHSSCGLEFDLPQARASM